MCNRCPIDLGPTPAIPAIGHPASTALGRRSVLVGLAGTAGLAVTGCSYNDLTTGGGIPFLMLSPEQERQLGEETWARIRAETPVSQDAAKQETLRRIGNRILGAAGETGDWEFAVFQGEEANAFALPGGKVGFYEGIFRYADSEAQLAAVVGHEIAHNQERHAAARLSRLQAADLGLQTVNGALQQGNIAYANDIAAILGAGVQYGVILPYSRNQELDADRGGLHNMALAGYDPRAALGFWYNMEREPGPRPAEFLSTHPSPGSRLAQLESLMPSALETYGKA